MSNEIKKKIFVEAHALTKAYKEVAAREGHAFDYRVTLSVYLKELFNKYKNGGDNTVALKSFNGETVLKADAGNIKIVFDCNNKTLKNSVAFKMTDGIFFWDLNKDIIFSQENKLTDDKRELFTDALASVGYKPELEEEKNNDAITNVTNDNNTLNIIAVETELPKTTVTIDKYNVELYKSMGTVGVLCDFKNKKYYFNIVERKVFLNGKLQNEKCHEFFNKALAIAGYRLKTVDTKYSNVIINKCIKYKNKNVLIQKDKDSDIIKFIIDKNVRMIRLGESFTFCGARIYSKEDYTFLIAALRSAGYNIANNTNNNANSDKTSNTTNTNSNTISNVNTNNTIYDKIISRTVIYNNYEVRIKKLKSDDNVTFILKNRMYNLNLSDTFITYNNKVQNTKCYEFFVGALKSIGYDVTDNNTNNSATTNTNTTNTANTTKKSNTNTTKKSNTNTTKKSNTNTTKKSNTNTTKKSRKSFNSSNEYEAVQMQFQI